MKSLKSAIYISVLFMLLPIAMRAGDNKVPEENEVSADINYSELLGTFMNSFTGDSIQLMDHHKKIVIIDSKGNIIREDYIDETKGFSSSETLIPIIYRSEYLMEIHGISYYLLEKVKG